MKQRYPDTVINLTRPSGGVYYAEVVGGAGIAAFRAFLLTERVAYREMDALPGGKRLRPKGSAEDGLREDVRAVLTGSIEDVFDALFPLHRR